MYSKGHFHETTKTMTKKKVKKCILVLSVAENKILDQSNYDTVG